MKLIIGDGITVEVYDISGPIYEVVSKSGGYIKYHGYEILSDDEARDLVEHLRMFGTGKNLIN